MYHQYFGLQEQPFSLTPDTQFYFNNKSHRNVLDAILLALKHSEGFIKIVGEVGTGKTLLCRKLLDSIDEHYLTAYIPNPYLSPDELKWFLAEEIGVTVNANEPSYKLLNEINQRLITLAHEKRQVVLIVDEAQAMPRETIESLRLLTNLETPKRKLLQVVLFGQPELDVLLNRPDLRQLKQRIVFSEYLEGIDYAYVGQYVNARLASAGLASKALFTRASLQTLAQASSGVPRLINILCHKAMMSAYGEGAKQIRCAHMRQAIADTPESARSLLVWKSFWFWAAPCLMAVAFMALLPFMMRGQ